MACARTKEVIELRIFRPKGLLVAFEIEAGIELNLLAKVIDDGCVRKVEVVVSF